ncbi:hypothetical protein A5792_02480 [Mycolicibacterium peregrinum]|uniref:Uncharacterized protein n=1 Tax=Mycolicibacterium peregrinum TaxID=43304 RepID=A0A1A0RDJ8_MYCPR|nr:hypothetical protein [Mycolicibacterium peregrinum]OBB32575.1 hypothetical protein A5792_02480 [Mycolicibacterium peregrinum]
MTPRRYSQVELRRRRRAHLPTVNTGKFSLSREIADVAGPLAAQVAALPNPLQLRRPILAYADSAHEAAGTVTGWEAERDARRRTEHLADDEGKRRYAVTTLIDLAPRPALPEITDEMIADGSWATALTEMVAPVDAALSDLLARAFPPGAPPLRGQPSRSDRLDRLLRETVDRAALSLERALDAAEKQTPAPTAKPDPRAELEAMGIEV